MPGEPLALTRAALAALEASRTRIDDLNVYPVPDGDTGTNMTMTVRAVVDALERDPGADLGRAILMGARGNSGVILSQLVRGALEALPEGEPPDVAAVARA
ncbi:MAG: DAK2 domain-containing protein, partial [Gaiellaceae bacterium]